MNPNRTSVCVLWKYSFADGIEKNWNRDEKAIVEPTNYNKLNKQKGVRQSLQIGKDDRQKDNQFIHFLTYMLIGKIEALKLEIKGKNSSERFYWKLLRDINELSFFSSFPYHLFSLRTKKKQSKQTEKNYSRYFRSRYYQATV